MKTNFCVVDFRSCWFSIPIWRRRIKDSELPCQRIILLLACLYVCVRAVARLAEKRCDPFRVLVRRAGGRPRPQRRTDADGDAAPRRNPDGQRRGRLDPGGGCRGQVRRALGRISLCHTLSIAAAEMPQPTESASAAWMWIDGHQPTLVLPNPMRREPPRQPQSESGVEGWQEQLERLLRFWV